MVPWDMVFEHHIRKKKTKSEHRHDDAFEYPARSTILPITIQEIRTKSKKYTPTSRRIMNNWNVVELCISYIVLVVLIDRREGRMDGKNDEEAAELALAVLQLLIVESTETRVRKSVYHFQVSQSF